MKHITFIAFSLLSMTYLHAQTPQDVLLAEKRMKEAEMAALEPQLKDLSAKIDLLKAEIESLKEQTTPYPRWEKGAFGNAGFNFSSFSDWLSKSNPNTTAFNIAFTGTGFANLQQRKYF